tara:strand:- start:952 stop:1323 length:372 start_codon:yes stop_codon:yes gene_type:complete
MNKIDSLAYLFAAMMDSDGKVNVKELNAWYQIVKKRWPEIPKEQAGIALKNSLYHLKSQNHEERINNLEKVLVYLKSNLKKSDLDNISKDLSNLIQADGLISIGEINLAGLLKWKLDLDIKFN